MEAFSPAVYTKIQAVLALFILVFEILAPSTVVHAATTMEEGSVNSNMFSLNEYIRSPEQSIVVLDGDELSERQSNWKDSNDAMSETIATIFMTSSAYNSLPWQTDGSPYHTAIGSMTRDGIVATNYFPIGTRLRFPDLYGDKEFRVEDRMNRRYHKTVDIWMEDYAQARQFGRKYVKVEVVKYGLGRGRE